MAGEQYFAHHTAVIEKGARIGKGTKIWHYSHIMSGAKIGPNCKLGQNVYIGQNVKIGINVKIQNNVSVYPGVTLENNVFCGPSMVFTNIINPRSEIVRNDKRFYLKTLVKEGASIGANATIVCGNTIGRSAFIGAGSVVTKDVPDYALVYGNPARIQGWMCPCGEKLDFKTKNSKQMAKCPVCRRSFEKKKNNAIKPVKGAKRQ
ncbi:MAG: N-acetyltransferase [Candidatus Omnitrophica bacterium]|nr:N-acetyltransferase [Candidatus Omnitrophota bacterium]